MLDKDRLEVKNSKSRGIQLRAFNNVNDTHPPPARPGDV